MNQQIWFKFILQYLEFSLKQDLLSYELTIVLKRAASQQTIGKLSIKNPERTITICRLPIDQVVEFPQKMVYKEGEYADYNVKFLFYLAGNQLIGDCVINLAYFLNGTNQDQKVKKPLTSTNDKRAALLFKMVLKQHGESQELPQVQAPAPVIQNPPQTARNSSTRKMDIPTRSTRARSQSPPKEFKTAIIVSKAEESPKQQPRDNLAEKLTQLGEKFQQEKMQQSVQQPEEQDNFKEITALLSQQEEELQNQINQLDNHIKSEGKFKKIFDEGMTNHFNVESEWKQKYIELEEKYTKVQEENSHLKRIIRQQAEQLRRPNQQSQASYRQMQADQQLNQSTASNQEQYEKAIEKKNQTISDLSTQLLDLQKNTNLNYVQQLKSQITRLEQVMQEKEEQWLSQEKIYQDKICKLLQE